MKSDQQFLVKLLTDRQKDRQTDKRRALHNHNLLGGGLEVIMIISIRSDNISGQFGHYRLLKDHYTEN